MRQMRIIKQKSIVRNTLILLAAITLGGAMATDALAAGRWWRRRSRWRIRNRPHDRWIPRASAGSRPFTNTALQSIESLHCASIARDSGLTGKSGVDI